MLTRNGLRQRGFTLIELMVAMVIAAILLALVVPSYQAQVRKSRRTEAKNAVLDLASREERFLSTANTYSQLPTDLGYTGANWAAVGAVGSGYYTLNVLSPDPAFVAAGGVGPSYVITATAIGTQTSDTQCSSFTVNQIGQQSSTNSGGTVSVGANSLCWN